VTARRPDPIIQQLRRSVLRPDGAGLTDGQLLESFINRRDEAAFEALVRRHGPMVLGVCRRLLRNPHDAEDAFQATFLVLARKAASVVPREKVGNWLHGVARTTALRARAANARRRLRERQVTDWPEPEARRPDPRDDLRLTLDRELSRLPEKYRLPVVLCDLEGRSRREVARQLRIPEGTLSSRLTTARRLLAKRLARQGLAGGSLAAALAQGGASACVPASVLSATVGAAARLAAGQATVVSAAVSVLTEGVLRTMLLTKLKTATALVLAAVLATALGTLILPTTGGTAADRDREKPAAAAQAARAEELPPVQVRLAGPAGMKVYVQGLSGKFGKGSQVEVPGRLNLEQGKRSRLKLADIPNRPGSVRFPTVEIPVVAAAAEPFVSTSAVPVEFLDADFDQVAAGTAITRVVYLPSRRQKPTPGARPGEAVTIASYDCEGDVVEEAKRRGTILAVVRMGDIDLGESGENKDQGQVVPARPGDKPVELPIGNDGVQGRVVAAREGAAAEVKDARVMQLEEVRRALAENASALAAARTKNEELQRQLKQAEVVVRSLRDALERKEQELPALKEELQRQLKKAGAARP
jgi:RNA polymerase sigma factor (sigma-70 family)